MCKRWSSRGDESCGDIGLLDQQNLVEGQLSRQETKAPIPTNIRLCFLLQGLDVVVAERLKTNAERRLR